MNEQITPILFTNDAEVAWPGVRGWTARSADFAQQGRNGERRRRHRGPDAGRPGLVQLPAGRPADRADWPPVAQGCGDPRRLGGSACAPQDDRPPYRYVSVEGAGRSDEELDPAEQLAMARRYLGAQGGDRYVDDNPDPGRQNVVFRMRPEHWLSQDQGKGQAAR
jgi:hypothetical protein